MSPPVTDSATANVGPARDEARGDGVLHRLVVDAEDDVAEGRSLMSARTSCSSSSSSAEGVFAVVAARGDAYLDALDARREERNRHSLVVD